MLVGQLELHVDKLRSSELGLEGIFVDLAQFGLVGLLLAQPQVHLDDLVVVLLPAVGIPKDADLRHLPRVIPKLDCDELGAHDDQVDGVEEAALALLLVGLDVLLLQA